MMKPVSNPPSLSPQITPVEDKHQKAATHRVTLMHPVPPTVLLPLVAWDPPKKMLLWDLLMVGVGSQPALWGLLDHKPKSRICSACMR